MRRAAVLAALALVAAPALGDTGQFFAAPAETDQPTPPGEDADDAVPDAVHCPRPASAYDTRPRGDGPVDRPAATSTTSRLPFVYKIAPVLADPPGNGAGVRLRC